MPGHGRAALLVIHSQALGLLLDACGCLKFDTPGFPGAFQQRVVNIDPMNYSVGVVEATPEGFAGGDAHDQRFIDRIVQDHFVGIHGPSTGLVTDTERIEGVKGIRAQLNTGADLADGVGLLQDLYIAPLPNQRQCRSQAADTAAGDDNG